MVASQKMCPCPNPQNLWMWKPYLEKITFADVIKILRWEHPALPKWALNPAVNVLRDRSEGTDMVEKATCRQRQRLEWCSQKPRSPGATRSWERQGSILHRSLQRGRDPASTLIADVCRSQWWKSTFLLFKPPGVVGLCWGSPMKPIQILRARLLQEGTRDID